MDWDDVRHFLALARLGSVRAAGSSLGVSHSTVARRVEALEDRLNARLFDRNRDGYTLTAAGREMLPGAERVEQEMCALERGLAGRDERLAGPVVITVCDDYVSAILLRELRPFCDENPEVELLISVDSRVYDLSKREADVAVRAHGRGTSPPEHLMAARLVPIVVASYVGADHDPRRTPARWLSFDDRRIHEPMVAASAHPDLPLWGSFTSLPLMVQAAREGYGLAMLPTYVGDSEPGLRRLPQPGLQHLGDLWLTSHVDLRDNARLGAVRARVRAALEGRLPLFRGESPAR